jgi:hypothetical protein
MEAFGCHRTDQPPSRRFCQSPGLFAPLAESQPHIGDKGLHLATLKQKRANGASRARDCRARILKSPSLLAELPAPFECNRVIHPRYMA